MENKIKSDYERFGQLTFSDFKKMAIDSSLSCFEKIGFPDSYRKDKEDLIFQDILNKLSNLKSSNKMVLDIGPGCSSLPLKIIDICKSNNHQLFLIDSQEMLSQLPNNGFQHKLPGFYPSDCLDFISKFQNKFDVIIVYSLLHYIFVEANLFDFLDKSLSLLIDGGQLLIGDIPNSSKRKRFLHSPAGIAHHQKYYDAKTIPKVEHLSLDPGQIDDAVLLSLVMRCRNAGYHSYLLPQNEELPMANRREDLLIIKP